MLITPHNLSFKVVHMSLREVGVTICKRDNEYKVRRLHSPRDTGYFTTDLWDAYQTGVLMSHENPQTHMTATKQTQVEPMEFDELPFPAVGEVTPHVLTKPTRLYNMVFPAGLACKLIHGSARKMVIFKTPPTDVNGVAQNKIVFFE